MTSLIMILHFGVIMQIFTHKWGQSVSFIDTVKKNIFKIGPLHTEDIRTLLGVNYPLTQEAV